ncbi:MAG TPA: MgtC/SapB family protein [Oligoflexus sp.]|uniref:MgtC/SapB family protein n=1 Tax=Oligoflexus sp. TaxID=1971216 RepID=UPI002D4B78F4|nr:MgtC/SapB family protein [Oligoflexus sp.]HYX33826.1 MgtC/SapB family protein [Oligoflexus sp.]
MLEEIWDGITVEFSDLPSLQTATRLCVRLLLSATLGGLIGYEREWRGKDAGLRTHMLVCLGTTFVIAAAEQARMPFADLSRIIQGIMAGIGFVGAGAIIKRTDKSKVEGLTTAASVWFTAALGIVIGMGREASAVIGTLFALGILVAIREPTTRPKTSARRAKVSAAERKWSGSD